MPDKKVIAVMGATGAQGGGLKEVSMAGMNRQCGLLVNSSRQIIYASDGTDFAEKAAEAAGALQSDMKNHLIQFLRKEVK